MHVAYIIVVVAVQEEDYGRGEENFTLKSHSSSSSYGDGVASSPLFVSSNKKKSQSVAATFPMKMPFGRGRTRIPPVTFSTINITIRNFSLQPEQSTSILQL